MNRTRRSYNPSVILETGWTQSTTRALDVLNKLAAISLIDATHCGRPLRATLVGQIEEAVDDLRHDQARIPTRAGNGHLNAHFSVAVQELVAATVLLRAPASANHNTFEGHLKRATGHLKAVTRASGAGQLFDLSKCCGAPHALQAVSS